MNRVIASFMAMASGWGTLCLYFAISVLIEGDGLGFLLIFAVASAVVIVAAWLLIFMPIYCLLSHDSVFFDWLVAIPFGVGAGFAVGYMIFMGALGGGLLAALVGGVAAAVGRYLLPRVESRSTCKRNKI